MRRTFFPALVLVLAAGAGFSAQTSVPDVLSVRVGYFLGGRTSMLMRMSDGRAFDADGLRVTLMSKKLRGTDYAPLDREGLESDEGSIESKATGLELINGVLDGRWELGTIGESSYVAAVSSGQPIVAVAALGHDVRGSSGHVFAVRKELKTDKPEDYRGLLLASRRAGPGDRALLREYLLREGVNLDKDSLTLTELPKNLAERARLPKDKVLLVHDVDDDAMIPAVQAGIIDGGFFHLHLFERGSRELRAVKPLENWANPDISQALLVCRRDYLLDPRGRETIKRFLRSYMRFARREHALKPWERPAPRSRWRGLLSRTPGYSLPQFDDVPIVKTYLLEEDADLLRRHGALPPGPLRFDDSVDNSLVLETAAEMEPAPTWRSPRAAPPQPVEWVTVRGGRFTLGTDDGAPDARPKKEPVDVKTFQMSKTLVTVEQYAQCVDAGRCGKPAVGDYCNWGKKGRELHPINCVDWNQAQEYAAFMKARLPSESEWEYAARSGGKRRRYPWGDEDATCARAVMYGNGEYGCGGNATMPVCSKPAGNTRFEGASAQDQLCDMAGNVWEWVQDEYRNSYARTPDDGSPYEGPGLGRVIRGGSYGNEAASRLRSDARRYRAPGNRREGFGFRLARSLP